ncbi:MAG: hypothetical protein JXR19_06675 [Bacteroidia bacterium]
MITPYRTIKYIETLGLNFFDLSQIKNDDLVFKVVAAHSKMSGLNHHELSSVCKSWSFQKMLERAHQSHSIEWYEILVEVFCALNIRAKLLHITNVHQLHSDKTEKQTIVVVQLQQKEFFIGFKESPFVVTIDMN